MDARHVLDDTNDLIYVRNIAVDEFSRRHLSIGSDLSQPTVCALKAHFFDEVIIVEAYIISKLKVSIQTWRERSEESSRFYITCNGKILDDDDELIRAEHYSIHLRVLGGKGGFGSLLRSFGSQISKNRNQDACRDLSGRRLRNVKAEKRVKELVEKKAEKDKDKETKKAEKLQKLKTALHSKPKHQFNDPEYEKQRSLIPERVFSAVEEGNKAIASSSASQEMAESTITTSLSVSAKDVTYNSPASVAVVQQNAKKRQHVDPLENDIGAKRMKGWLGLADSESSEDEKS